MPVTTPPGHAPVARGVATPHGRATVPHPVPNVSGRISGRASVPAASGHVYGGASPARKVSPARTVSPGGPARLGWLVRDGRPRWGRLALVAVAALITLGLVGGGSLWAYASGLDRDLARTDAFAGVTGGRPAKAVDGALNILMVGSDSRDPNALADKKSKWRADSILVLHIPSSHDRAYLISLPRDLYVTVPETPSADCSDGDKFKINAAFAFGGLPLAVKTVECYTGVRLDHVVAVDFGGFKEVTDALGGVDLNIEQDVTSVAKPFRTFKKGVQHVNGEEALDYVRQRQQFPDGDFARMRHQQEFLRALMDKAVSSGTLANPGKLNAFLKATTSAVTVDEGFSLLDMAMQFRNLRADSLTFMTSPHNGSDTINGESVVVSNKEKAQAMYKAIADDKMADWVRANPTPAKTTG